MMQKIFFLIGLLASAAWSRDNAQDDPVRHLNAVVTGNQEQPAVVYVVPWKDASEPAAVPYQPIRAKTHTLFEHWDRSEHQRHLKFLRELSARD